MLVEKYTCDVARCNTSALFRDWQEAMLTGWRILKLQYLREGTRPETKTKHFCKTCAIKAEDRFWLYDGT